MKLRIAASLLVLVIASPTLAWASREDTPEVNPPIAKHFDFEDDFVQGDLRRPDGDLIVTTQKAAHKSLIEIRTNFIPEMIKSLEDI